MESRNIDEEREVAKELRYRQFVQDSQLPTVLDQTPPAPNGMTVLEWEAYLRTPEGQELLARADAEQRIFDQTPRKEVGKDE